jgi:hypothetical protein
MSVDIKSVTQPQSVKSPNPLTAAVHRASTTALAMAVAAVALVGVDGIVAIHRDAGSSHSTSATAPGSGASPIPGTQVTPTSPGTSPATPGATTAPSTDESQKTLQAVLVKTYATALLTNSVHSLARDVSKSGGTAVFDDQDATSSGEQRITIHGGHIQIRVVGSTTYFTGDQRGLEKYFQFSKQEIRALNGQWLSLVAGQAGYTDVTAGVTLASTLDEDKIASPLRRETDKTIDGQRAFGISGLASGSGAPKGGHATMWINVSTGLPVEYDASNGKTQLTQTFTDWGKPIHVETPVKVFGSPGLSS